MKRQHLSPKAFQAEQLRELTVCFTDSWNGETTRLAEVPSPALRALVTLQLAWFGDDDLGPVAVAPETLSSVLSDMPGLRHVHLAGHLGRADLSDLTLQYPTISFTRGADVTWTSHRRDCSCVRCQSCTA